ncbi:hypothetical protein L2E82_24507 [Cichorium intybus]|uniref:Uncharacterized protein n=1 Tax=Cichorium intybus TaxID=13427 RepID=A0ACB9E0K8_CICIN|nr:hypothetical protein L2E82_24507 [Cichorium intybus]
MEKSKANMEESAKKIGDLEVDVLHFMKDFKESTVSNNERMSKVIQGFADTLKAEREAIATLRSDLRKEHSELASFLQAKTELKNTTAVLTSAVSQSHTVRNCVTKIGTYIRCFGRRCHSETRGDKNSHDDSDYDNRDDGPENTEDKEKEKEQNNTNISDVSKDDKVDGKQKVTESPVQRPKLSKVTNVKEPGTQESADDVQKLDENWFEKMKVGDTSVGPSKRKTKKIGEDDVDEDIEISEAAKLARDAREKELDELLRISRKLDAEETAKQEAEIELEARKTLFHDWDYEIMKSEAITQPIENWLQPNYSYDVGNQVDSQFDFPMTARAFLIRCFDELTTSKHPRAVVNDMLFNFYLEHSKPQYLSWSLKKIVKLTPRMPHVTSPFRNAIFLARRGSDEEKDEFTLADLPFMNPFDWVSLFNILKRREDHEILFEHVKRLLMGYILEVSTLDVEVAAVLNSTLKVSAEKPPSDLKKRRLGKIKKDDWNVAYPSKEGRDSAKRIFFLRDKHLY